MEQPLPTTPVSPPKRSTPWGAIISLFLILAIVVAGAYYSFTKRYQPSSPTSQVEQR